MKVSRIPLPCLSIAYRAPILPGIDQASRVFGIVSSGITIIEMMKEIYDADNDKAGC